jgi:hypothetical protein
MLLGAVSGQAQSNDVMRADIPFSFVASGKSLPAGEYTIHRINGSASTEILLLQSRDGHDSIFVRASGVQATKAPNESKLVFTCYGDQRFLSELWTDGDVSGLAVTKSHAERELARNKSAMKPASDMTARNWGDSRTAVVAIK